METRLLPFLLVAASCLSADLWGKLMARLNTEAISEFETATEDEGLEKEARRAKKVAYLAVRGIDYRVIESPGGHNWTFWHENNVSLLSFHYQLFDNPNRERSPL